MSLTAARPAEAGSDTDSVADSIDRASFYAQIESAFAQTAGAKLSTHLLRLGPGELQLNFCSADLARRMLPPLEHLSTVSRADALFRVCVSIFDSARLPDAPWSRADYDARGLIAGFNDPRFHTLIDPTRGGLRMLDRKTQRGVCYFPSADEALQLGFTTPLLSLLAGFLRYLPLQIVHAGAVGLPSGGVLLTGKGGAGKSTTVAACVASLLGMAGDDLVLVDLTTQPIAHALLETIKLDSSALARLPALSAHTDGNETLPRDKHVVWARRIAASALLPQFPLRAVIVPAIRAQRDSQLIPMSPAEALRSLAPSTLQLLPGGESEAFEKMARLVRKLPCFKLEAGSDLDQPPRLVRELLERLS